MKLLRYSILACLLICILADDDDEESQQKPGFPKKHTQQLTLKGSPVGRRNLAGKNRGGQGGRRQRCTFKLLPTNCAGSFFCSEVDLSCR
uniref:Pancreatic trypsin inhibitor n=1 Tax=Rhipicephalus zambeziensis TaxID=60191 RepID=A0A224Y2E1_9ACAR